MIDCPKCGRENPDDARFCPGCGENLAALSQDTEKKDPYIGKQLEGKFLVLDHLGDGGMGKVYRAEQLSLNKIVAIKILHKDLLQNDTQVKRFQREAWSASRLDHPNSIAIIDFGQTEDGAQYIVMENLKGKELADVIRNEFPLSTKRVVHIVGQILSVLHEAHENKIIHRDLKPENIMLIKRAEEEDFVKVLDFGIAKLQERDQDQPALTMQGMVCGTPEYMSPEQAMGQDLDPRTDIYSVGCILFEMLVGRVPFCANNFQAILGMHIRDDPQRPSEVRPDLQVNPMLEEIALKAMAKEKDFRFKNALAMKSAIERAMKAPEAAQASSSAPKGTMVMGGVSASAPVDEPGASVPPPSPVLHATLAGDDPTPSVQTVQDVTSAQASTLVEKSSSITLEEAPPEKGSKLGMMIGGAVGLVAIIGGLAFFLFSGDGKEHLQDAGQGASLGEVVTADQEIKITPNKKEVEPTEKENAETEERGEVASDEGAETEKVEEKKAEPTRVAKKEPAPEKKMSAQEKQAKALDYYEKGNKALRSGDTGKAIAHYRKSKNYNPNSPSVYKKLGMAYMKLGKNKNAKSSFKSYLRLSPSAKDASRIRELLNSL